MLPKTVITVLFVVIIAAEESLTAALPTDFSSRIIYGNEAKLGQFPWQAAVYSHFYIGSHYMKIFCGGSLITPRSVLTSAQCTYQANAGFSVYLGVLDTSVPQYTVKLFYSEIVKQHENFDPKLFLNDLAIVRSEEPVPLSPGVIEIIPMNSGFLQVDTPVTISGWGAIKADGTNETAQLRYLTLNTISNKECTDIYHQSIDGNVVCAAQKTGNGRICMDDIGGPLVIDFEDDSKSPSLVGVASFFGGHCLKGYPSGFTRIQLYIDWIKSFTAGDDETLLKP